MDARKALERIELCDTIIKGKVLELKKLEEQRTFLKAVDNSSTRVQTSGNRDGFTDSSIQLMDITAALYRDIRKLEAERKFLTGLIYSLKDGQHIRVLCMRYIDCLRIDQIADKMDYSYRSTLRLISEAVKEYDTALKAAQAAVM